MTPTRCKFLPKLLPQGILFVTLMAIYLRTLAPGLSWANDGSDGGDLITAAATGGVAHPTGYPLYLLLARLFQLVPIGTLAYRTNLLSAIAMAFAAVLVYILVVRTWPHLTESHDWFAGMAAGYAFGLAPLIWSQAVITEVYGLHAMLAALIMMLYIPAAPFSISNQKTLDCLRGLTLGLAIGNHISILLLLPVVLAAGSMNSQAQPEELSTRWHAWFSKTRWNRDSFLRQLGMFSIGLSLYLIIPIRASANPPVNWGYAISPERFWWLVSGELYRSYYLEFNLSQLMDRVQGVAAILVHQFGLPGTILGLVGLFLFWRPSRLFLLTSWMAVVFTGFAIVYGSDDSYVYLIPAFLSFAVWIGTAIKGLASCAPKYSDALQITMSVLLLISVAGRSMTELDRIDASADLRAETFGAEVFSSVPGNAILFATGDQAVFTLWYFHFALGERPDVVVLATELLPFDWYQENLHFTYPSLHIPSPFPWPETIRAANPARPACYVQFHEHAIIECVQDTMPAADEKLDQ